MTFSEMARRRWQLAKPKDARRARRLAAIKRGILHGHRLKPRSIRYAIQWGLLAPEPPDSSLTHASI